MATDPIWVFENYAFAAAAIDELEDEIAKLRAGQGGWRNHSVNFARAERCPQTVETLQAAWDRDQELIEEQRAEIAKHKQTINQLRQKATVQGVNQKLLGALEECAASLAWNCFGECRAIHAGRIMPAQMALETARAAIAAARKGE